MATVSITVKDDHKLPLRVDDAEVSETVEAYCQRQIDALVEREDDRDLQIKLARVPKADVVTYVDAEVAKIEAAK